MISDDAKFNILHDHYKDSFRYLQTHIHTRSRLLFYILIVTSIMAFQIFSPEEQFNQTVSQLMTKNFGEKLTIDISFIGSVIWLSLLALVVRYFQTVIYIERQYKYMHKLENEISANYKNDLYIREGYEYTKNYPIFSKWVHLIYTILFPIILVILAVAKIAVEQCYLRSASVLSYFNILIFICILVSIFLYLLMAHFGK